MCNAITSAGIYLQSKGIGIQQLSGLPKPLRGLPQGVIQRLSASGIISRKKGKAGRIYADRAVRVVWERGHNWDRLEKWMEANDERKL